MKRYMRPDIPTPVLMFHVFKDVILCHCISDSSKFRRTVLPSSARVGSEKRIRGSFEMLINTHTTIQHHIPEHLNPQEDRDFSVTGLNEHWLSQSMTQKFIKLKLTASAQDSGCYAWDIYCTERLAKTEHLGEPPPHNINY
jgi:hypothetical protein